MDILKNCNLCPRKCGVNRYEKKGFCGETSTVRIARAELHKWEEPCISGENGSGTVFFSGCCLKCCFCQNYEISSMGKGFEVSVSELADTFLRLKDMGAENINLVNPTHFVPQIMQALDMVRENLNIPIVYNCGGYENIQTIEMLNNYVQIFLPDFKYYSSEISKEYSLAEDYFEQSLKAIKKMYEITGKPKFDERGMMKSGVIVRHLVLPNCRKDSIKLMQILGENFKADEILVSLMSQYTPVYKAKNLKNLNRRVSTFEYNSVVNELQKYGFKGFMQSKQSADDEYIPEFYDKKYY